MGFPGGSDGKESACNVEDLSLIPGLGKSPGGGHGNPLQYSCLNNPHEQKSLASYSPWGRRESDMTEQLSAHTLALEETAVPVSLVPTMELPGEKELWQGCSEGPSTSASDSCGVSGRQTVEYRDF